MMSKNGVVVIHGREYKTVALRVSEFREQFLDYCIFTEVISSDEAMVVIKATIKNDSGIVKATGYSEEMRGVTQINKTSALENCETSAIGRALANFGFAGQEYASANEVSDAIILQAKQEVADWFIDMNQCIRDNIESIDFIKREIASEEYETAAEAWYELTEEDHRKLWVAPTKGGIFTTTERDVIQNEFSKFHPGREG